jgi:hypothetical protein
LKAAEWFRRGRLLMVSPVHGDYRRCQAEIPLIVLSKFPRPALLTLFPALCLRPRKTAYAGYATKTQGGQEISDREVAAQGGCG